MSSFVLHATPILILICPGITNLANLGGHEAGRIDSANLDSVWRHAQDGRHHVISGRINYVIRKSHCIQNAWRRTFCDHTLNRYHNPSLGSSQWADIMTHTIKDISTFIHSYLHEIPCLGESRWPRSLLWRSDSARTVIATLSTAPNGDSVGHDQFPIKSRSNITTVCPWMFFSTALPSTSLFAS
jgi:hypothetical protein